MSKGQKYLKLIEWSEPDQVFIGSCPELFYGGCHGTDPIKVFAELCDIVEETVAIYEKQHKPLPEPLSSRDLVNRLHQVA